MPTNCWRLPKVYDAASIDSLFWLKLQFAGIAMTYVAAAVKSLYAANISNLLLYVYYKMQYIESNVALIFLNLLVSLIHFLTLATLQCLSRRKMLWSNSNLQTKLMSMCSWFFCLKRVIWWFSTTCRLYAIKSNRKVVIRKYVNSTILIIMLATALSLLSRNPFYN